MLKKSHLFALLTPLLIHTAVCANPLTITTPTRTYDFTVEIADTPEKAMLGLMHRPSLAPDAGMVFITPENQIWHMWMKNTLIPLDMLFFDRTGRIRKIIENTQPHDLTTQSSDIPVAGVLELNAGTVAEHKIQVGDMISFDALNASEK